AAAGAHQESASECWGVVGPVSSRARAGCRQAALHLFPERPGHQALVLALYRKVAAGTCPFIDAAALHVVADVTHVDLAAQDVYHRVGAPALRARGALRPLGAGRRRDARIVVEPARERAPAPASRGVARIQLADDPRVRLVGDKHAVRTSSLA